MKSRKIFFSLFFIGIIFTSFSQKKYKLYVEGEKHWAYRENVLTDFVYAFCTKNFEQMATSPIIADKEKTTFFEEIYNELLKNIPKDNKEKQISLFFGEREMKFGERKITKKRIFFMNFFLGNLQEKRNDAFFQIFLIGDAKEANFKCKSIDIPNKKDIISYKEPSPKEKFKYQKDIMDEFSANALSESNHKSLEEYFEKRKRWKNLFIEESLDNLSFNYAE